MKKIDTDILILGAGWSGLTAADRLLQVQKDVIILEKEPQAGGLARTLNYKGFKFDIGGHRLYFKKEKNIMFVKDLLAQDDLLNLKRKSRIFLDQMYISYPLIFPSIFKMNKKQLWKIFFEIFQLRKDAELDNCEAWLKSNYGETLYKIFFKDYTEKVWGQSCDRLSSVWSEKRIGRQHLFDFFKDILVQKNGSHKERAHSFNYPRGGIGALIKALEYKIAPRCRIYPDVKLGKFRGKINNIDSLVCYVNGEETEFSFKALLSTIPLKELLVPFSADHRSSLNDRTSGVQYRSLILVCMAVHKEIISDWHWCYFPSKDIVFSRIHEPKFWSPDMAPHGQTLLCIEIFCDNKGGYWEMPDEEIIERVKKSLNVTALLNGKNGFLDACVKRIDYAYPLCYKGFERPLSEIKGFLSSFKNLYLGGRSGTHSYFDMEECLDNIGQTVKKMEEDDTDL